MKSIIIDTNIFISALLKSKNCIVILEALKQDKFKLIISEKLIEEILIVANEPKFEFSKYEIKELEELIREKAEVVETPEKISLCRDPKDNIVLECASAGKLDFIVTGNKDLLSLKKFKNIPIITPFKFVRLLR